MDIKCHYCKAELDEDGAVAHVRAHPAFAESHRTDRQESKPLDPPIGKLITPPAPGVDPAFDDFADKTWAALLSCGNPEDVEREYARALLATRLAEYSLRP